MRTGRIGYVCAAANCDNVGAAIAPAARRRDCLRESFIGAPPGSRYATPVYQRAVLATRASAISAPSSPISDRRFSRATSRPPRHFVPCRRPRPQNGGPRRLASRRNKRRLRTSATKPWPCGSASQEPRRASVGRRRRTSFGGLRGCELEWLPAAARAGLTEQHAQKTRTGRTERFAAATRSDATRGGFRGTEMKFRALDLNSARAIESARASGVTWTDGYPTCPMGRVGG